MPQRRKLIVIGGITPTINLPIIKFKLQNKLVKDNKINGDMFISKFYNNLINLANIYLLTY